MQVDLANRRFRRGDQELQLEPRVFAVITQLLARPGQLVTRNELLDAVWGHRYVTPSTLNRTIALARRAFGDESDEPRYIQTVHGAGYRYVGPLDTQSPELLRVPSGLGPPPTVRLPARIEDLIGRSEELEQLVAAMWQHRAVTVLGPGGMGKTQCALEAARRVVPAFADGVWFLDLAPLQSAEQWLQALAVALAMPIESGAVPMERLAAALRGRNLLLVLDNCDRIATDTGALVIALLRATDELRVLATSQSVLRFQGEHLFRMPPLGLPSRSDLAAAAAAPAVQLLLRRVRAVQPEFELRADNAAAVVEICHRLDGMPLALELAATRFALLSPEQVLQRLEHRFGFLNQDVAGSDIRHRNLLSLLDWSYALLSPDEQRLLNWCAVFVQTWTVESALMLFAGLGHSPEKVLDLLSGLVARALINAVPGSSPPRYRLLETVRFYALERLAASGELQLARLAHVQVVRKLASNAHEQILAGRMPEVIEQLIQDQGNITAALETAMSAPEQHHDALEILGALLLFGKGHGEYLATVQWCRRVLDSHTYPPSQALGRALLTYGVTEMHVLGSRAAIETATLAQASAVASEVGDWWAEAYASGYFALSCANAGRTDAAEHLLARAESLCAGSTDALLQGLVALVRGWILLAAGQPAQAAAVLEQASAGSADVHQDHFVAIYVGLAHFMLGHLALAASAWSRSLSLVLRVRNRRGLAGIVEGCAYLCAKTGRAEPAARFLAAAALVRKHTGIPLFRFWDSLNLQAQEECRSVLGLDAFSAAQQLAREQRLEAIAEEVRDILLQIAAETAIEKRPSGS